MRKVVHFEIPADDLDRAKQFYRTTFGWQLQDMPEMDYTIVRTADVDEQTQLPTTPGAINGGMMRRTAETPAHRCYTIDVDSIDDALAQVTAAGRQCGAAPNGDPGHGRLRLFKDSEGNTLGLWENV
jgi:uncharacterized protein